MAEKEPTLSFNRETGGYEGAYTITFRIESEIVRRALFRYAEENNIDPANLMEWEKAIEAVTRSGKWIDHPRSKWLDYPYAKPVEVSQSAPAIVALPVTEQTQEVPVVANVHPPFTGYTTKPLQSAKLSSEDEAVLREVALQLPVDEWDSLQTSLPTNLPPGREKEKVYQRRYAERQALNRLKAELEPAATTMLHAVASTVNGARIH